MRADYVAQNQHASLAMVFTLNRLLTLQRNLASMLVAHQYRFDTFLHLLDMGFKKPLNRNSALNRNSQ